MSYFVIEEDLESVYKVYIGEVQLSSLKERMAMTLGEIHEIPSTPLIIPIKHRCNERMSDYLNVKFNFVSDNMKNVLEDNVNEELFFRHAFLTYEGIEYPYYYLMPKKYDCIDFEKSNYEKDDGEPGGIRISNGFALKKDVINNSDIFRAKYLSNKIFIISERLKKILEENDIVGIKYTHISEYKTT